jgi:CCR4-Not complex component, Not1
VQLLRVLRHTLRLGGFSCLVETQGTLRVLLVLLHDFPELLCEYHFALCDCVPPSCIQVRLASNAVRVPLRAVRLRAAELHPGAQRP